MNQASAGRAVNENPSNIGAFFTWIWSKFVEALDWFSIEQKEYPPDESGELMRRFLARKSWFDNISAAWVEQSFLLKISYIFGFILISGLVGLLIGGSVLLSLSALVISVMADVLFVSHEHNRWEAATVLSQEAIALTIDLKKSQQHLQTATSSLSAAADQLKSQDTERKAQATALESESQRIHQATGSLSIVVDSVTTNTKSLQEQEKAVTAEFQAISVDLKKTGAAVTQSTEAAATVKESATELSESVRAMRDTQQVFSLAVERLSFFANKPLSPRTKPTLQTSADEALALLKEQNDKHEKDMEAMKTAKGF